MHSLNNYNKQRRKDHCSTPCWAPQKSMFIGLKGYIYTCCYNKSYPIGRYPEKPLKEIWFGNRRKKQEDALGKNDFSLGCQNCKRIIEAGNFKGLPAKNFDMLSLSNSGYPTKIDFELSNECNLECIMCRGEFSSAIRKNREKLAPIPQPYEESFLEEIKEFIPHLETCHFLGGEPFLIPIYEKLWELISKLNPDIEISVQTNATILTERIKERLESNIFHIAASIDSIEENNYEVIRKNGNFKKVLDNIHFFRDYCRRKSTNFSLSYCPMPQNWRELGEIVAFANELDCKIYFNKVDFPKSCSFQSCSKIELESIIKFWSKIDLPSESENESYNKEAFEQVIAQVSYMQKQGIEMPDVKSIDEYLIELKDFVKKQTDENSDLDFENLRRKIFFILDSYGSERKLAESHLLTIDYKSMFEGMRQIEDEHALHLFNSFILPHPNLES